MALSSLGKRKPSIGYNPARGVNASLVGGGGVNSLAAGSATYGQGRPYPNMGKVTDKSGYGERDAKNAARTRALQKRMGAV